MGETIDGRSDGVDEPMCPGFGTTHGATATEEDSQLEDHISAQKHVAAGDACEPEESDSMGKSAVCALQLSPPEQLGAEKDACVDGHDDGVIPEEPIKGEELSRANVDGPRTEDEDEESIETLVDPSADRPTAPEEDAMMVGRTASAHLVDSQAVAPCEAQEHRVVEGPRRSETV